METITCLDMTLGYSGAPDFLDVASVSSVVQFQFPQGGLGREMLDRDVGCMARISGSREVGVNCNEPGSERLYSA